MQGDNAERNHSSDDLVFGQRRSEAADREVEHAEQEQHEIGAEVSAARACRRLMGDRLEEPEVNQRRQPEDQIEDQRAEKFREHDLPVAHRRGHERLDRAELKFLGEQPHRDEWKD